MCLVAITNTLNVWIVFNRFWLMIFMKMNAIKLSVSLVVFWLLFMYWCSVGMGSGSAGKEGGPFKALLRQQTQSALEQRVRVTQHSLFLYC